MLMRCPGGCLQVRVVRIFNTYGPNMALDDGRVVSNFVAQARLPNILLMRACFDKG